MSKRFQIVKTISTDHTGSVYEAIDNTREQRVALRRFTPEVDSTDPAFSKKAFISLGKTLATIKHPFITSIYETGFDDEGAYLSRELVENARSIENILDKQKHFSNEMFFVMATQILKAFAYMHSKGICHSGLNGGSIVEMKNEKGDTYYQCVDIGLSAVISLINPKLPKLVLNDPALTAPELFEGLIPDQRTDIYMLGQVFYLSLAGGHPLAGIPADDAYTRHKKGKIGPLSGYRSTVPDEVVNWIDLLTQPDPSSRPASVEQALLLMPRDLNKSLKIENKEKCKGVMSKDSIYTNVKEEDSAAKSTPNHTSLILLFIIFLSLYFYFYFFVGVK